MHILEQVFQECITVKALMKALLQNNLWSTMACCLEWKKLLWTLGGVLFRGTFELEFNWQLSNELVKFERAEYGYTDNSRTGVCYKRLSWIKAVCSPEINERFNEKCSVTVEELIVTKVARVRVWNLSKNKKHPSKNMPKGASIRAGKITFLSYRRPLSLERCLN